MNEAYLSLGSNEGDRIAWLQKALELLAATCGEIVKISSIYETAAWGLGAQPDFLNMAVLINTDKSPEELLQEIHNIETALGRQRNIKWGPRTLDIDILLYNHDIIQTPELKVPHPFLHERRFTLVPLVEIAPRYIHPQLHQTVSELLAACPDQLEVHKYAYYQAPDA
jgi:2-amino-4-hydroxy-6-hydroxymethyldihydropteridine diphosphokinase